jgi:DNA-directed RNA polymerase specialized sigma24 family protein
VIDEESADTDRAVTRLPAALKHVIVVYYLKPGTVEQKAKDCRCCRKTLFNRLHHAHQRLDELLSAPMRERVWPMPCVFSGVKP